MTGRGEAVQAGGEAVQVVGEAVKLGDKQKYRFEDRKSTSKII